MKYFLKKYKSLLAILGFISIVLPLFYFSFTFMLRRIQSKADLIQTRIIDNNLEKAKIGKIPEMEKANAEFETSKDAVGTILAFSSKVEFIEYVEALAEESHNKIELKVLDDNKAGSGDTVKIKTKTAMKKDADGEDASEKEKNIEDSLLYKQYISMQVDLEGDYAGFLNFIHKLENNKYYVNIISFNLQKGFTEKEEATGDGGSSASRIFAVPVSQNGNSSGSSDGDPVLRSSLNIIIYTE